MSDNEFTPSLDDVAAVFAYAELPVAAERLAENHETYTSTLALIRKASTPGLGETVPAVGFKASWD
ncbi:hypothetical protein BVC93_06220 [Mycobacterium sp. MS1601]|uniref:hypothetical protein n=1 Tax=Mycobacterium sp. MS1601 TaxID=1936029 RepID=UPI00097982E7|nr:hypothetical protein [Mycobacterium sp. MS1601]AQA02091.1 hypothetical protein BVC93_06220 [Mycobacterium sp. MS1601]